MKIAKSIPAPRLSVGAHVEHRRCGRLSVVCFVGALVLALTWGDGRSAAQPGEVSDPAVAVAEPPSITVVHLYFADQNGRYLQAEERIFAPPENGIELGRSIMEGLIKGPKSGLMRTLPPGTRLRGFYLAAGNRAYVDVSESIAEQHPGGCQSEILSLYSIVNSLVLNMPEVSTVTVLVGGRDVSTLAGHIDIRQPFTADMSLIR
ncbi:MAG: GerMN domain-containing protein [Desulfobacterales bacterium]